MERQPPPKVLQLKFSMYHANFCTKFETIGPPRRAQGLPSFVYEMKSIMLMALSLHSLFSVRHRVRLVGPGTGRLELY